jgi:hypothetical protein
MCKMYFVIGLCVLLSGVSEAQSKTQADTRFKVSGLSDICRLDPADGSCRFYIFGVMEGLGLGSAVEATSEKKHFCIPEGVTSYDVTGLVKTFMKLDLAKYPEDNDMPAVSFVAAILQKTYPCQK